jgi:hypothetical protein
VKPDSFDIANDGNLFPREDLLEAVARSDWRDREVPAIAWVLTGVGLSLLAAGLPVAEVLLRSTTEFAAGDAGPLAPLHAALGAVGRAGVGIEAAAFLTSAVALGATLPALGLALRAAGFRGRLAFVAALIGVSSPLLLMHGRLPSDGPLVALGSALLLAAVAAPRDPGPQGRRGYSIRVGAAALLLLALCGASRFAAATGAAHEPVVGRWSDLLLLGGTALLAVPMAWRRQEEEAPPPFWLVVWLLIAAESALTMGAQAGAALVPPLTLLVANALARRARPDGALRWAAAGLAGQVALAAAVAAWAPADTRCFAASGPGETAAGDVVVTEDLGSDAAYLLRRRLGLEVVDRPPEGGARRVLFLDEDGGDGLRLDASTGQVRGAAAQADRMPGTHTPGAGDAVGG